MTFLEHDRRPAFTLIEVLVVIFIIGVLMALLVPAIQSAREAARRGQCLGNLRQFGVALANYQSSASCFPPSVNGLKGYSVHSMILSQLEQSNVFNAINFQVRFNQSANQTALNFNINVFNCPSDTAAGVAGTTSYACNVGYGYQLYGWNGSFADDGLITPASFADGTANTVAMSEWTQASGSPQSGDARRFVYRVSPALVKRTEFEQFILACQRTGPADTAVYRKGSPWINGGMGVTLYNHDMMINQNSCLNNGYIDEGAWTAGSGHPASANCLFADGHAAVLKDSIALSGGRSAHERAAKSSIPEHFEPRHIS